jgi:excisionase family DNA binding protein
MQMHDEVLAVDIREAARRLSLSARTVAALVARQELASRKIGRKRIIPVVDLEKFINRDCPADESTTLKQPKPPGPAHSRKLNKNETFICRGTN